MVRPGSHRFARHSVRALVVGGVTAALAFGSMLVAAADPAADRRDELTRQIFELGPQQQAALNELNAILARKAPIDARVAELDGRLAAVNAKLAPLEAQAAELEAKLAALKAETDAREAELGAARDELRQTAAMMYRSRRALASYDFLQSYQPGRLIIRNELLKRISDDTREVVDRVVALKAEIAARRADVTVDKVKVDAAKSEIQVVYDEIAKLRAEVEPERAAAAAEAANYQRTLSTIQSRKSEYERELASLRATSDSIGALLRSRGSTSGPGPGNCQARPVPGGISSGYGTRIDPIGGGQGFHAGVDMNGSTGTPIKACRGGTVIIASWQGGYGNAVVIDHGSGMGTVYGHQSQIAVSVGATVSAGQTIGYVGSTGYSTGPHLHFEVRITGNPVNPVSYL
jgi:murein DD-endopeptidase MepM/ murein hydrolase activator NlpD